jgi:hypothetical protein
MTDTNDVTIPQADLPAEGIRARKVFVLRQFIPDANWIAANVVAKGKGTKVLLGRVWGVAMSTEHKTKTLDDGKVITSVAMNGAFQAESYITGELSAMSTTYLPDAYALKVAALFETDKTIKVVEIDCDVGLEATGKTIPYEWVIIAYREGEEMAVLKRLRNSRGRPTGAPALAAPPQVAAIEGPAKGK